MVDLKKSIDQLTPEEKLRYTSDIHRADPEHGLETDDARTTLGNLKDTGPANVQTRNALAVLEQLEVELNRAQEEIIKGLVQEYMDKDSVHFNRGALNTIVGVRLLVSRIKGE